MFRENKNKHSFMYRVFFFAVIHGVTLKKIETGLLETSTVAGITLYLQRLNEAGKRVSGLVYGKELRARLFSRTAQNKK